MSLPLAPTNRVGLASLTRTSNLGHQLLQYIDPSTLANLTSVSHEDRQTVANLNTRCQAMTNQGKQCSRIMTSLTKDHGHCRFFCMGHIRKAVHELWKTLQVGSERPSIGMIVKPFINNFALSEQLREWRVNLFIVQGDSLQIIPGGIPHLYPTPAAELELMRGYWLDWLEITKEQLKADPHRNYSQDNIVYRFANWHASPPKYDQQKEILIWLKMLTIDPSEVHEIICNRTHKDGLEAFLNSVVESPPHIVHTGGNIFIPSWRFEV